MSVIVVASAVAAVASLLCLVLFWNGAGRLDRAGVAGLAALVCLVSVVASLLASAGLFGQGLLHHGPGGLTALYVAAGCFAAQLVCMVVGRIATKPRRVPRRVDGWRLPSSATAVTVLVYDVKPVPGGAAVETFTRAGRLRTFTTELEPERCRALLGHQTVAIVSTTRDDLLLDLVDLRDCVDEPIDMSSLRQSAPAPVVPVAAPQLALHGAA